MTRNFAEGAVIFAPRGRDAVIAQAMLVEGGLAAEATPGLTAFVAALRDGAGSRSSPKRRSAVPI